MNGLRAVRLVSEDLPAQHAARDHSFAQERWESRVDRFQSSVFIPLAAISWVILPKFNLTSLRLGTISWIIGCFSMYAVRPEILKQTAVRQFVQMIVNVLPLTAALINLVFPGPVNSRSHPRSSEIPMLVPFYDTVRAFDASFSVHYPLFNLFVSSFHSLLR